MIPAVISDQRVPTIPRDEYARRREACRAQARDAGLDGVVAWSTGGGTLDRFANVFFLTNHYQPQVMSPDGPVWAGFGQAVVVLPVDGAATLVVDQHDWRTDLVECDRVVVSRNLYHGATAAIEGSGLATARIGVADMGRMTAAAYKALCRELPGAELVPADHLLMNQRMIKSPAELELMRHASAVGVETMNAMLTNAVEGRTDADLVAAGFTTACRLGAQPYDFAMASGPEDAHLWWARLPSWNWRRAYRRGDIVHPDIYGAVDGYFYDFVRSTVVGGEPTAAQLDLLEGAIGAIHAACAAARPGARARDVYAACIAYLNEHGLAPVERSAESEADLTTDELPCVGHGLGLGWEEPWIAPQDETVLQPSMVLALEHHVTRPGVGTVRFEETIVIQDGDPEILTRACPARWW